MPQVRTGAGRVRKYSLKFDPDIVRSRFAAVKDLAVERAEDGMITFYAIETLVKDILDKYGITGPNRATYLAFAKKLYRHALRHGKEAGIKVANGLKEYWVTAYGANPSILDEIINVVTAIAIPY